ncbi:MAG: LuxR C-terminal-related transcriptional regulator [Ilumatobacter sp.]|uniref:LuxR C-terminal-related transcriptional regulator n=1 Tax=Ilumatobacter sp. TaxID=1967498 RepID=UPI003918F85A
MDSGPWPFVGRDEVVDACRRDLDRDRSVLIAGPGGVGKTRVARELADHYEATRTVVRVVASLTTGASMFHGLDLNQPVLLVIDDIQMLDADIASVLATMVVSKDLVVLATMRTEPGPSLREVPAPVTVLWKDDHIARIDVGPLERNAQDELVTSVLPGRVDRTALRRLWGLTKGSPLFVSELLRSSVADGALEHRDGTWYLVADPHSNRLDELIASRVDDLVAEQRHVVDPVAVGEPLPFVLLRDAVSAAELDAAERSGLIEVVADSMRRDVRMAHPMFGDVARRRMTASRSSLLHRELLSMIERTPLRRRDDIVRASTWQLRAGGTPVTDDMVLAARRALYDRDEWLAIELASHAMSSRRVDAAIVVCQAFVGLGQPERAARLLAELGGETSDADRAMLGIQRAVTSFWALGDASTADRQLRDAELEVPAGAWRDEIRSERAVIAAMRGRLSEALDLSDDLIDETRPIRVYVTAAIAAGVARALDGRSEDAMALAARAFELGSAVTSELGMSDPGIHLVAQALASSEAGELTASEELARLAHAVSVEQGHRNGQAYCSLVLGRTLLLRGRAAEAATFFAESAATFGWLHSRGPQRWALAGALQASALSGAVGEAERWWEDLCRLGDHPAQMMGIEVERAGAWLLAARRDVDGAISRLGRIAEDAFDVGAVSLGGAVAHDVVRLGGVWRQSDVIERLGAAQGRLAPARAMALEAARSDDPLGFETAGEHFAAIGADLFACEAFQRSSTLSARRGLTRDAARARRRAAEAFRRTGEEWFCSLALAPESAGGSVDGVVLTHRESAIAQRAAQGRSNRDIADELGVSVRTVENHLQRVYEKFGVTGRRDLAGVDLRQPRDRRRREAARLASPA